MKKVRRFILARATNGDDIPMPYDFEQYESLPDLLEYFPEITVVDIVNRWLAERARQDARMKAFESLRKGKP